MFSQDYIIERMHDKLVARLRSMETLGLIDYTMMDYTEPLYFNIQSNVDLSNSSKILLEEIRTFGPRAGVFIKD